MVSWRIMAEAWCAVLAGGGLLDGGLEGARGMLHKPLSVRRPSMMTLLFFNILTLKRENMPMQSSSHNCPNEIKDPVCMLSKMITL